MDSEQPVPQQDLLLQDLLRGTLTCPTRHVALAPKFAVAEVGRVVAVDATWHVELGAVAGGQGGVVGLQGVILGEKW